MLYDRARTKVWLEDIEKTKAYFTMELIINQLEGKTETIIIGELDLAQIIPVKKFSSI